MESVLPWRPVVVQLKAVVKISDTKDIPTNLFTPSSLVLSTTELPTSLPAESTVSPQPNSTYVASDSSLPSVTPVPTTDISSFVPGNATAILPTPTEAPSSVETGSIPLVPSTTAFEAPQPTGSDIAAWISSSIYVQPLPTGTESATTTTMASGIPSFLPQVVAPLSGIPSAPADNTLIQVGFLYPLNYQFVSSNAMSSAQIFMYLPQGIAYGLNLKEEQVIMHSLQPYDTSVSLGYITTLALAFIPTSMVAKLAMAVHTPVSPLYSNPALPVFTIMSHINPAIPIQVGGGLDGVAPTNTVIGGAPSSTPATVDGGVFNTDAQNQSSGKSSMTAGIATGAVAAAAAYGAAMFFIARRYKKRKLAHRRTRSVMNPAEMMQANGSPALMGGAFMSGGRQTPGPESNDRNSRGSGRSNGNSAKTAQISAPMMAENSLGWN